MKKTLLLSVVASTMIMAGGDIAPVEPVVEAPVVEETSGWEANGQIVGYVQTVDEHGIGELFGDGSTYSAIGVQMGAINKDIFAGIGAGFEVSAIMQDDLIFDDQTGAGFYGTGGNAGTQSAGLTQAYLTYGLGNTSLKVGRQTLPQALSPFAFTEGWQMFKNTFDAALVVNSDIPDTTLVYAAVTNANGSVGPYLNSGSFNQINNPGDIVHMLTVQNKSVSGLTLTGTAYYAPDMFTTEDALVLWGDAKFGISDYSIALQGGTIMGANDAGLGEDTVAFGAKVGANFDFSGTTFGASVAFSSVDEGVVGITNLGTGVKSPLYTQMVLNNVGQLHAKDSDYLKASANVGAFGGKFVVNYGMAIEKRDGNGVALASGAGESPYEVDVMYTQTLGNTKLFAAYVLTDGDIDGQDSNNFVRVWARYSF
ncbi:MAG TPA: hypothetical protein EYG82_01325 [Sulfurovum sp.]|nr:hypothetical protein [Sulfurovum sp.]